MKQYLVAMISIACFSIALTYNQNVNLNTNVIQPLNLSRRVKATTKEILSLRAGLLLPFGY